MIIKKESSFVKKSDLDKKYTKHILIIFGLFFILGMRFLIDGYGDEGIRAW